MKVKVISIISLLLAVLFSASIFAYEIATTDSGEKVKLNKNGTYTYISKKLGDKFNEIDFTDFLIDSNDLVGKNIRIKGVGGFNNRRKVKYPSGTIYQKTFTIGPSISIDTTKLNRKNLKKIHKCPLTCIMEISGVVKNTSYNSQIIEAISIRVLNYSGATILQ